MVTDRQVRRLMSLINKEGSLAAAAAKAGMDEKTARKYRRLGKLPSEAGASRTWRTREDPFEAVWPEIREKLEINPGLEAKTLFEDLLRRYPGRFGEGQLRTLQRRIKRWRALAGPMNTSSSITIGFVAPTSGLARRASASSGWKSVSTMAVLAPTWTRSPIVIASSPSLASDRLPAG